MADENENIEASATVEAAAAEALADVASAAIEETADRTAALVAATAEIATLRAELAALHSAFLSHVESNRVDFELSNSSRTELESRVHFLETALEEAEKEIEQAEQTAEVAVEVAEVANVEAAIAEETPPEEIHEHVEHERETHKIRKRHFIRI